MATMQEIVANYRPTGSVYSPFSGTVPVDYVPNLTRRRNHYLKSVNAPDLLPPLDLAFGGEKTLSHSPERPWYDVPDSAGVIKRERNERFPWHLYVEDEITVPVCRETADLFPEIDADRDAVECTVYRVLRESDGAVLDTVVTYGKRRTVIRPVDQRPAIKPRPAALRRRKNNGRTQTRAPRYVFNGATGQKEWRK